MKNLKSKFKTILGLMFLTLAVNAQPTKIKSNDYLAANSQNTGTEVSSLAGRDEMHKLKMELIQLKAEVNALTQASDKSANRISTLKNIRLNNNSQQRKASVQILLPETAIDGQVSVTDKYGRIVFNQNIRNGASFEINYASWLSGEYAVGLFTDGELAEATSINIKY